jgi:hypothetical protein
MPIVCLSPDAVLCIYFYVMLNGPKVTEVEKNKSQN